MPAAFIGHGSPMNALETNRYTEAWEAFGRSVPRPRAILVISAHWYINATAITAMAAPKTIHDFYGFPQALFDMQYPAPGAPEIAQEIADLLGAQAIGLDKDSWGIDHGAWSVLVHMFPKADIPVLQLSLNASQPLQYHVDLGAKLAVLREKGILIVGSGNVVHNLGVLDWRNPHSAFDWNKRFNQTAIDLMTARPENIIDLVSEPDFALAVPTLEHFIPLLYLAGIAHASAEPAQVLIDGYAMGSLSMTAFTVGADPSLQRFAHTVEEKPEPESVIYGELFPGPQTNL